MPQKSWSAKSERQYVHIKDSLLDPGTTDEIEAAYDTHMANPSRAVAASAVKARLAYPFRPCRPSKGGCSSRAFVAKITLAQ